VNLKYGLSKLTQVISSILRQRKERTSYSKITAKVVIQKETSYTEDTKTQESSKIW
jgi:hypothetical protein